MPLYPECAGEHFPWQAHWLPTPLLPHFMPFHHQATDRCLFPILATAFCLCYCQHLRVLACREYPESVLRKSQWAMPANRAHSRPAHPPFILLSWPSRVRIFHSTRSGCGSVSMMVSVRCNQPNDLAAFTEQHKRMDINRLCAAAQALQSSQ